jgi:hypothetical protein
VGGDVVNDEQSDDRLPTEEEINGDGSLDGQWAAEQLHGKSVEEVEQLFRNDYCLQSPEDLEVMGPYAFQFYVRALTRYLTSESSRNDPHAASYFVNLLESRLDQQQRWAGQMPVGAIPNLLATIDHLLASYEKFDLTEHIFGDLRPRCRNVRQQLQALAGMK